MKNTVASQNPSPKLISLPRARDLMEKAGIEILVAHSKPNVYYSSEFRCFDYKLSTEAVVFAIITSDPDEGPYLVAPHSDRFILIDFPSWVENKLWFGHYYIKGAPEDSQPPEKSAVVALARALSELGAMDRTIGLELELLPVSVYNEIREAIPVARFVNASPVFRQLRMIKSAEEISRLTKATKIIENAIAAAFEAAGPGISELELEKIIRKSVADQGGELRYITIGANGRAAYGQCYPTDRKLQEGDVVKFDGSAIYKEYVSDIGCTCVVGRPSDDQKAYYEVVARAGRVAVEMVKPGVRMADVFHAAMQVPREAGIKDLFRHHVGHGIGLEHEEPRFTPETDQRLEENMVLCIEVPYYVWGLGGFHAENTIVVTENGHEYLFKPQADLPSV